ncbi:hypothetical protein D5F01_LYC03354 [Larimichthys crocea]|uniref:Uncharacterized protein n=1 Tax=Larimichthys crocea TaxID=215358 RepID=A0A6G0J5G6_LARCR|nr:hypothetical protein D5F01_LYC03354 [Larimichthys crocea]
MLLNRNVLTGILLIFLLLGVLYYSNYLTYSFVSVEQEELTADSRHVEVHFQSHELHMVAPDHLKYDQPSILTVLPVPSSKRWQEISARRLGLIQKLIEEKLRNNSDYIFCLDVDSKFHGRWGTESLGGLIAVIHQVTTRQPQKFPYEEARLQSLHRTGEGDFYYCGGGRLEASCRKSTSSPKPAALTSRLMPKKAPRQPGRRRVT